MASHAINRIESGYPLILGANKTASGYNFAVEVPTDKTASLLLYRKHAKEPTQEIPLTEEYRTGRVCSVLLPDFSPADYEYNFTLDGKVYLDPCAYSILGREHFGAPLTEDKHRIRCGFLPESNYDWEGDKNPCTPYKDMILYKVHVRGYTKACAGEVKKKGTFAGLMEMIPYWKSLGVTAIELMPAYEFAEVTPAPETEGLITERRQEGKVNYWGYIPGSYFAPKRAYCATKEPEREVKDLVKALHKAGMECIMEMFFPKDTPPFVALRAVQFWKLYYHVDGFHFMGDGVPLELLLKDGVLGDTKLMAPGFDYERQAGNHQKLAQYNGDFLQNMRRFLKSDEDTISAAAYHIRSNPENYAVVNYLVNHDGFTLNDLVSYNYKHNEENGEDNQDGCSYNYSWNCGVEGPSRKAAIRQIRDRQMRNAFLLTLLSQGVPMIYGGDEIANSQNGNNNAYCQDNAVGWVDWKGLKRNKELLQFVKEAIAFRKEHPILHMPEELRGVDYKTKGCPDVSVHGERAWFCSYDNTSRLLGLMYCGAYAEKEDGSEDDFIYVGYNFHWEERDIALPNLPEGCCWKKVADTAEALNESFFGEREETYEKTIEIGPRSIVVLIGKQEV